MRYNVIEFSDQVKVFYPNGMYKKSLSIEDLYKLFKERELKEEEIQWKEDYEKWKKLMVRLEEPTKDKPGLRKLLEEPSVLEK